MVKPLVIKTCVKRNSRFLTRFLFQLIQRPPARGPFSLPSLATIDNGIYCRNVCRRPYGSLESCP